MHNFLIQLLQYLYIHTILQRFRLKQLNLFLFHLICTTIVINVYYMTVLTIKYNYVIRRGLPNSLSLKTCVQSFDTFIININDVQCHSIINKEWNCGICKEKPANSMLLTTHALYAKMKTFFKTK